MVGNAKGRIAVIGLGLMAAFSFGAPVSADPVGPLVGLNDYCQDPHAVAHQVDGRTVYCSRVRGTDAYVWSYTQGLMPIDPHHRDYTCADVCRTPDGDIVPNYRRCGTLCGEPPTSGDIQSGLYDCFRSGTDLDDCRRPR